ncbi:PEP-CTERM system TPR-repeat protein PrsT [Thalassotalea sp. M1531]|uniref:PEP-CTERM system TPR-repeat protein PrsT n=1 Tax=Thalassotalea algicola TaxID=2716224 RepID=A0A7Y0LBJ5_9GAMM|nr:XrtA/PEP-CTERM system TPR-repeat protein PrsT [Thalassotalea algicola]NMP31229.1 PEP-CTERM system TPR-repeat protein PrsT [Thalassotalea algicola]
MIIFTFFISVDSLASNDLEKAVSAYQQNDTESAYIHLRNALQKNENNLPAKVLMGRVLLDKGLFSEAIQEFNDALAMGADPHQFIFEQVRAMLLIGRYQQLIDLLASLKLKDEVKVKTHLIESNAYIAMEKEELALEPILKAKSLSPKDISVISSLTNFYINTRDFKKAEVNLKELLILAPDNSKVWNLYSNFHSTQGQHKNALNSLEKAYELDANDPVITRALAHKYTDMRMHDKALALVNIIIEKTPNDPYARLLKSQLLTQSNQLEEAQQLLVDISTKLSLLTDAQKNSNSSLAYVSGTAAFMQGNLELAQKELIFYVNDNPNDLSGLNMLSAIYSQQGQVGKIQELLERNEKIVLRDLGLSLKLFNIYIKSNKIYKAKNILDDLAKTYPNNEQIIIAQSNYLAQGKRFEEAIKVLNEYKPPTISAGYVLNKGLIYLEMGEFEHATSIADELLKLGPKNTSFRNFKGVIYLKSGEWEQAASIFESILEESPQAYTPNFNLANAYARLNKAQEALALTNSLIENGHGQVELLLLNAKLLRDNQQQIKAIEIVEEVVKTNTTNISAINLLMTLHYQQGNFQEALKLVKQLNNLLFMEPSHLIYHANILIKLERYTDAQKPLGVLLGLAKAGNEFYQLSQLYIKAKSPESAYKTIEQAISKAPNNLLYLLTKAKLSIDLKPLEESKTLISSLDNNFPNNPNVKLLFGDWYMKKDQLENARNAYAKALTIDNSFEQAAAKLYHLANRKVGAKGFISVMEKVVTNKNHSPLMRNLLADFYLNTGHKEKAKKHYELLLKSGNSNKANILNNLANIYLDIDLSHAQELIEQAIELRTNSPAFMDTHGWILALQGKYDAALNVLRNAYALDSSNPAISYHLGYALYKLERLDEAKQSLTHALASAREYPEKNATEKLLEKLSN